MEFSFSSFSAGWPAGWSACRPGPGMGRKEVWTGGRQGPRRMSEQERGGSQIFFYFPLHFLCVVTYLLFRHACNAGSETNVWVQEGGYEKKKKGVRCLKKKKPLRQRRQKNLEQQESLHANFPRTTNGCNRTEIPVDKWIQLFGPTK